MCPHQKLLNISAQLCLQCNIRLYNIWEIFYQFLLLIIKLKKKMFFYRTLFCEKYIIPRTTAAGKYISLYRKIRDHGHYIHPVGNIVGNAVAGSGNETISKLTSIQE